MKFAKVKILNSQFQKIPKGILRKFSKELEESQCRKTQKEDSLISFMKRFFFAKNMNKPGTAQVGAISKAQKDSKRKTTFSTTGDNKSSQKTKN